MNPQGLTYPEWRKREKRRELLRDVARMALFVVLTFASAFVFFGLMFIAMGGAL